jgi:hypothetical protein
MEIKMTISLKMLSILTGEDNTERACRDIPEIACKHSEHNYRMNLFNGSCSKLAEQVSGPNIVIPWLLTIIGAPAWSMGLVMPMKQAFSLIPQLFAAGYIRRLAVRKHVWTSAGVLQALCLFAMIPAGLFLSPVFGALVILLLLAVFSTASGTASVAFQDVLGKTIDKGRRGGLLSARALVGGILTIAAGLIIGKPHVDVGNHAVYYMVACGAFLWFASAMFFGAIKEDAGATEGGRNAIEEAGAGFLNFKRFKGFRLHLYVRALLLAVEVAVPYFVLFANQKIESTAGAVGMFITAIGISQLISSPFWGKLADKTSRTVLIYSGVISAAASGVALFALVVSNHTLSFGLIGLSFLMIGLAESGVRLGRKTYIVDAAPKAERPTFTAFSNSLIGVLALGTSFLGIVADKYGSPYAVAVLGVVSLAGAFLAVLMPEAEEMTKS